MLKTLCNIQQHLSIIVCCYHGYHPLSTVVVSSLSRIDLCYLTITFIRERTVLLLAFLKTIAAKQRSTIVNENAAIRKQIFNEMNFNLCYFYIFQSFKLVLCPSTSKELSRCHSNMQYMCFICTSYYVGRFSDLFIINMIKIKIY